MPTRRTSRAAPLLIGLAAIGLAAIGLASCSAASSGGSGIPTAPGHSDSGNTSSASQLTSAKSDQDFVDFAHCMRAHGVNQPDPVHIPGHTGLSLNLVADGPHNHAAFQACNHFLAPVMQEKQAGASQRLAAQRPALTRYAECMRSHDIPMLDPNSMGTLNLGHVAGISNDFGRYSPQFHAADAACRHFLPAGVSDNGTGP